MLLNPSARVAGVAGVGWESVQQAYQTSRDSDKVRPGHKIDADLFFIRARRPQHPLMVSDVHQASHGVVDGVRFWSAF